MAVHRNRVIYQSEALFISPDATGYHFTGAEGTITTNQHGDVTANFGLMTPPLDASQTVQGAVPGVPTLVADVGTNNKGQAVGWQCGDAWPAWNPSDEQGNVADAALAKDHGSIIKQLKRVQSANYGFTINRQDINQFGHASRLDSVVVESPTVNLDFSYYLLDGFNERQMEFVTNGAVNTLSGMLTPELYQAGNNFFILTAPEARDAVIGDAKVNAAGEENSKSVISLGNGYITDYSVDIAVGSIPTASVTVEGMNIRSDFGTTGNDVPAMNMRDGSRVSNAWGPDNDRTTCYAPGCTGLYSLPASRSGYTGCEDDIAALRPGDVVVDLQGKSLISKATSGDGSTPMIGSAHIQSANISLPLARTSLQRLGSVFGFSKAIDLPLSVTVSVNALLSDIKRGNMVDLLCDCEEFDISILLFKPDCNGCVTKQTDLAMKYTMKGARLESENFSSTIGDNKSVDLTFTTQIGSSDDMVRGLYISGAEAGSTATNQGISGLPPAWTGVGGQTTGAADGFLFGYRE
tara:strand:- start:3406 stop:4968 length:1563 start_codon:yes stop_codon:yes gene_type:complete